MAETSLHQYKVLYIGGYPDFIQELNSRPEWFDLTIVENGLKAMSLLKDDQSIQAIICETYLPGMNGIDIAEMRQAKQIHEKTPFVLVSPEKDDKNSAKAFKTVVNDFYEGKLDAEKLYHRIYYLRKYFDYYNTESEETKGNREYKIPWDKRLFDIVVSFVALLILSPLLILVMIAIRLESKGKVFYTSKRVGTGYRIFDFYKLRSMRMGADAALKDLKHLNQYDAEKKPEKADDVCPRCASLPEGEYCSEVLYSEGKKICEYWYFEKKKQKADSTFIKIKDDPRVTRVGKFIRNTSIDELPQLVNVFKGDMSIVGNRPLPLYEAEMLTSDDWSERFMGPAGITGLWQVEKRGKKGSMSEEERKALDNQYARNYSFWGDIKLILKTIPALFQKENV
ncbi:MAG: sugar transferase [Bacteroidales bacterium]|jgi:lipopolysaccharide/colanic/teichoic acid biosynthesis glycosyltransferase|nr:sugar transferase [Bacteroidales bacterium]MDD4085681.1 sugar transferase [Bacteroidales bacterium]MDY0084409.1 sugar transferase [Bacteroidales bacterium]